MSVRLLPASRIPAVLDRSQSGKLPNSEHDHEYEGDNQFKQSTSQRAIACGCHITSTFRSMAAPLPSFYDYGRLLERRSPHPAVHQPAPNCSEKRVARAGHESNTGSGGQRPCAVAQRSVYASAATLRSTPASSRYPTHRHGHRRSRWLPGIRGS